MVKKKKKFVLTPGKMPSINDSLYKKGKMDITQAVKRTSLIRPVIHTEMDHPEASPWRLPVRI